MPRYDKNQATEPNPLFQRGTYDAVVKRAVEKVSAAGNDMIEVILTCYAPDGTETDVFDYLVFSPGMLYKVRHFCESAGIDFDKGELAAEECVEQNVRVQLKIEKQEGYRDKNSVDDYVGKSAMKREPVAARAGAAAKQDADIPF